MGSAIRDPLAHSDRLLEDPAYFASLLVFAQAASGSVPWAARRLIGLRGKLPEPSLERFEALLQGLLFDDRESFAIEEGFRDCIAQRVGRIGGIARGRVDLTMDRKMQKAFAASRGKLLSAARIMEAEYRALGPDLRMLVLCDHIKKEALGAVGDPRAPLFALGAVPLFEVLRRAGIEGVRLGMVCGSMAILPADAMEALRQSEKLDHPESASLVCDDGSAGSVEAYLEGGTLRDKALFADALEEFLGPVRNPRYLLRRRGFKPFFDAFPVPRVLGARKEDAETFHRLIGKALGPYRLIYTRTPEGRRALLRARWRSFGTLDEQLSTRVRIAKGPLH